MSNSNDPLRAVLELVDLPSLGNIFDRIEPDTLQWIKPLLSHLSLLNLLNQTIGAAGAARDEEERRALIDLARLAVAKHDYTRQLYAQIVAAVLTTSLDEAGAVLADLPLRDARLAMEMLALVAESLALAGLHEKGVYAFQAARLIAVRFGLEINQAVVFHQLGVYELRRRELANAEAALQEAAHIFARLDPSLERQTNYLRAQIYKLRLQLEPNAPALDDLERIAANDPRVREVVLLARAKVALDRDDLAIAGTFLQQLSTGRSEADVSTEELLVKARLARREGRFEAADLLLLQATQRPDAAKHQDELTWQQFYLARDLGHVEHSQALLARLEGEHDAIRVDYQRALVLRLAGDKKEAERLFRSCLARAKRDSARADCMGMLGLVSDSAAEARRFMYESVGLNLKLGRKLDYAVLLSNMAHHEFYEGAALKEAGWPMIMLSQFTRADNLLKRAQVLAEELGASSFLLTLLMNRARLEFERARYNVALRHFERAVTVIELAYLALTDHRHANLFVRGYTAFYTMAIKCALSAGKYGDALLFSERSKARRFLRDAAEITEANSDGVAGPLAAEERRLFAIIRPLRSRLIQQRPLSSQERHALYVAEEQLGTLWQHMRQDTMQATELALRVQQPVEVNVLRHHIYGREADKGAKHVAPDTEEQIQELPGGGVMQCANCFLYNRISSTFCSACETMLPKSVAINMNLWSGNATEDELREAFADHLYNQGVRLFSAGEVQQAEQLFRRAMEHKTHPDYSFFHGLCRLVFSDSAGALASFDEVSTQQYAAKYPFWPLPVSPSTFRGCIEALRQDQTRIEESLRSLLAAYSDYSEQRRRSS